MEQEELILEEKDRSKLDGIVSQMEANGESEENIRFVVDDFKGKYGKSTPVEQPPLKKKENSQSSPSNLQSSTSPSDSVLVSQDINIPSMDAEPSLKSLYEGYMKSVELSDKQMSDISETLTDQKEGNRSWWETAKAVTKGFLQTGMYVPLYNFDNQEDLVEKASMKNKLEYLEQLPEQDKARIKEMVQDQGQKLNNENGFLLVQNRAMEARSKEIAEAFEEVRSMTPEELQNLPEETKTALEDSVKELKAIQLQYNSNMDTLESNSEDIGTFQEEIDLLKRNYNGLDNFIGRVVNTSRGLVAGGLEVFGGMESAWQKGMGQPQLETSAEKKAEEMKEAADYFTGTLRRPISINDVSSAEDFGEWLSDQVANQLPIITALVATGGTTGSVLLGASSGGQKSLEMKKEMKDGRADYSDAEIFFASVGNGTMEFLGERVTGGILSKGKRTLQAASKEGVKKGVAKMMTEVAIDAGKEGLAEGFTQVGQNMIDRFYLDKKDVDIFDGVEDAIAAGGILGGMMNVMPAVAGSGISLYQNKKTKGQIRANVKKLKDIQDQLNKENLDPIVEKELKSMASQILKENKKIFKKDIENIENKSAEDLKEVSKINKKIKAEETKARQIVNNPEIDENLREDLSKRMLAKLERYKAQKDEILDPQKVTNDKKGNTGPEVSTEATTYQSAARDVRPSKGFFSKNSQTQAQENVKLDLQEELRKLNVPENIIEAVGTDMDFAFEDLSGMKNDLTGGGVGGFYEVLPDGTERVRVSQNLKGKPFGKEVIIHEAVHAASVQALSKLQKLDNFLQNNLEPELIGEIREIEGFTKDQIEAARALREITELYKNNVTLPKDGNLYGFNNVKEFVAEFIANPEFRGLVSRTKPGTKIDLMYETFDTFVQAPLQKIWENILKLLGIDIQSEGGKRIMEIESNIDKVIAAQQRIRRESAKMDIGKEVSYQKDYKNVTNKDSMKEMRKLLFGGFPILSYIDEKVFTKLVAEPLEKQVTAAVKKGLDHKNKLVRNLAEGYVSFFNGVARTDQEVAERRKLTGKQEGAYVRGSQMTKQLQELIGYDVESATKVHKVMDPELYADEDLMEFDQDGNVVPVTYDSLNDQEKMLYDMLREINDATHETNYQEGFISDETYEKFKGKYIGRGYEVFEDLTNEDSMKDFINNKIFNDIYKERKEITDWMIDNKVTDPIYLTVNRMIRTERNVAVKRYAEDIANSDIALDEPKEGYSKMSGKSYGPLDGKYIPNYLAEDFKGYFFSTRFMDSLYDLTKAYDTFEIGIPGLEKWGKIKPRQIVKKYHTVYSPTVQVGNFMSNHAFAFAAGVNLVQLWNEIPSARKSIKKQDSDYMTLLENGIIGSNILTPDLSLTRKAQDKLKLDQKENIIFKKVNDLEEWSQKVYSGSDDIMKLSAYKALKRIGYTTDEAIQRVYEGFQNYATVGKIWDLASKTPIIGNAYIKFQADLMRIVKNATLKRPLTTAVFLGALRLATLWLSESADETEEERKLREGRPFIPKINIPILNEDIPLVARVPSALAKDKEVNLARFISPYYDYDVPNKDWVESFTSMLPLQMVSEESSEMGQNKYRLDTPDVLLGPIWAAFMTNKDFRQKSITDPYATRYKESGLTDSEKLVNKFIYSARSVVPLVAPFHDLYLSNEFGEDYYGRSKTPTDLLISKWVKVQTWDTESKRKAAENSISSIEYEQKNINNKIKAVERRFAKDMEEMAKKLYNKEITQEQFYNKMEDLRESSEKRIHSQMEDLVEQQQKMNELINSLSGINFEQ